MNKQRRAKVKSRKSELSKKYQAIKDSELTEKQSNAARNEARKEMNSKYGSGWRSEYPNQSTGFGFPSRFDGHENGQYWMD